VLTKLADFSEACPSYPETTCIPSAGVGVGLGCSQHQPGSVAQHQWHRPRRWHAAAAVARWRGTASQWRYSISPYEPEEDEVEQQQRPATIIANKSQLLNKKGPNHVSAFCMVHAIFCNRRIPLHRAGFELN
jgi:hypothetical protein